MRCGRVLICWDRNADSVIGVFKPVQISWLRRQLTGFRDLVDWRLRQYTADDPLAAQLGVVLPPSPTTDERLRAVLDRVFPPDELPDVRLWWEADVLGSLRSGIEHVVGSLPDRGGIVVLRSEPEVRNWIAVMAELQLAYAITTGMSVAPNCPSPGELPPGPQRSYASLLWWLHDVVAALSELADRLHA